MFLLLTLRLAQSHHQSKSTAKTQLYLLESSLLPLLLLLLLVVKEALPQKRKERKEVIPFLYLLQHHHKLHPLPPLPLLLPYRRLLPLLQHLPHQFHQQTVLLELETIAEGIMDTVTPRLIAVVIHMGILQHHNIILRNIIPRNIIHHHNIILLITIHHRNITHRITHHNIIHHIILHNIIHHNIVHSIIPRMDHLETRRLIMAEVPTQPIEATVLLQMDQTATITTLTLMDKMVHIHHIQHDIVNRQHTIDQDPLNFVKFLKVMSLCHPLTIHIIPRIQQSLPILVLLMKMGKTNRENQGAVMPEEREAVGREVARCLFQQEKEE
mmetsp:Transcript_37196/g.51364  ORF Transcript_37196/g.51364 Transcript_37196/m.51364 type:complete len:326 (-) Transcript_37196:208-1185(-)